ncbi:MAG: amino acid permease [Nitrososphaeria archaeon]|nr:amino acid permease [Nitrososphaeria archaeon]NIQ34000.1 amino acid permease [Nitrososphaeria archaeon]
MGGGEVALTDGSKTVPSSVRDGVVERALSRELTLLEAVTLGVGGIIGGGIYSVLGIVAGVAGPALTVSFFFCTLTALLVGYNYARLGRRFPSCGASYEYVARAFPRSELMRVCVGYSLWFGYIVACSFYSVSFGLYASHFFPSFPPRLFSAALIAFFLVVNVRGVSKAGKVQDTIVLSKVGILIFFVLFAIPSVEVSNYSPFFPRGFLNVFTASALIFIGYTGFEIISTSGEELKSPERNMGRAIYIAIGVVSVIYLSVAVIATGIIPYYELVVSEAPMAELAKKSLGRWGELILGFGALLATSSAYNAALFGSSRLAYAMSRGGVMPQFFSSLSRVTRAPIFSLVFVSIPAALVAFFGALKELSALASLIFLVVFFSVSLSNLRLRRETGANPVFPWLAMLLCVFFIVFVELVIWLWFILLTASVVLSYYLRKWLTNRGSVSYKGREDG